MKKKKKAYFSKTFVYLVLLIAAVAGFFIMVNYATNQKLSMNSEASGTTCKQRKGDWYRTKQYSSCSQVKEKSKDARSFTRIFPSDQSKWPDYICCVAGNMATANRGKDCRQAGGPGADWYKPNFSAPYSAKYIVRTLDMTGYVGSYYKNQNPGKLCLVVTMTKKPSCADEKGAWYDAQSCSSVINSNNSGYRYIPVNTYATYLSDYKSGKVCCRKSTY